jgi:hypothetical protein
VVVLVSCEPRGHRFERVVSIHYTMHRKDLPLIAPQTPHSAGAYDTGYVFFLLSRQLDTAVPAFIYFG